MSKSPRKLAAGGAVVLGATALAMAACSDGAGPRRSRGMIRQGGPEAPAIADG